SGSFASAAWGAVGTSASKKCAGRAPKSTARCAPRDSPPSAVGTPHPSSAKARPCGRAIAPFTSPASASVRGDPDPFAGPLLVGKQAARKIEDVHRFGAGECVAATIQRDDVANHQIARQVAVGIEEKGRAGQPVGVGASLGPL